MSNATRVDRTKGQVTLDEIRQGEFQKEGTLTAQLRMKLTTVSWYPSKKVTNELNGGLFTAAECGFQEQSFSNTEERVAFITIPETATAELVKAKLVDANKAGCTIYRVLSNQPILSEDQKWAVKEKYRTLDQFADAQVMRYPEGSKFEGDLIKVNGSIVYRKTFFSESPKEDMDLRSGKVYHSAAIMAELGIGVRDFTLNGDIAQNSIDTELDAEMEDDNDLPF